MNRLAAGATGLFGMPRNALADFYRDFCKRWAVFDKAAKVPFEDPNEVRCDPAGYIIHFSQHGNRESPFGWEMDHHPIPKSQGGPDEIGNLRPLHWRLNVDLGNALRRP